MEDLIKQAFAHIEVIGPHVADGHYDLKGPNGDIILPQIWETVIEPDWNITMHMWPIPEKPKEPDPPPAAEAPPPAPTKEEPPAPPPPAEPAKKPEGMSKPMTGNRQFSPSASDHVLTLTMSQPLKSPFANRGQIRLLPGCWAAVFPPKRPRGPKPRRSRKPLPLESTSWRCKEAIKAKKTITSSLFRYFGIIPCLVANGRRITVGDYPLWGHLAGAVSTGRAGHGDGKTSSCHSHGFDTLSPENTSAQTRAPPAS